MYETIFDSGSIFVCYPVARRTLGSRKPNSGIRLAVDASRSLLCLHPLPYSRLVEGEERTAAASGKGWDFICQENPAKV